MHSQEAWEINYTGQQRSVCGMEAQFVANVEGCRCCGQADENSYDGWVAVMQEMLGASTAVRWNTVATLAKPWEQSWCFAKPKSVDLDILGFLSNNFCYNYFKIQKNTLYRWGSISGSTGGFKVNCSYHPFRPNKMKYFVYTFMEYVFLKLCLKELMLCICSNVRFPWFINLTVCWNLNSFLTVLSFVLPCSS